MSSMQLKNKVAVITGASSGIGKQIAAQFAKEGAIVVTNGRKTDALQSLLESIEQDGGNGKAVPGDVTDVAVCQQIIETTLKEYGQLDILVNAAGIIATGSIENTTTEAWREMMAVNLDSVFYLMNLATPNLIKTKGSIVNISSVTGVRSFPNVLAYCVSKSGVDQLTRCAALELAEKGVRVNAINPGVVETELHRRSGMGEEKYSAFLEHSKTTHPLGRAGQPYDIAEAALFLASEKSGWITGVTLNIDGGRHLTCAR